MARFIHGCLGFLLALALVGAGSARSALAMGHGHQVAAAEMACCPVLGAAASRHRDMPAQGDRGLGGCANHACFAASVVLPERFLASRPVDQATAIAWLMAAPRLDGMACEPDHLPPRTA